MRTLMDEPVILVAILFWVAEAVYFAYQFIREEPTESC